MPLAKELPCKCTVEASLRDFASVKQCGIPTRNRHNGYPECDRCRHLRKTYDALLNKREDKE